MNIKIELIRYSKKFIFNKKTHKRWDIQLLKKNLMYIEIDQKGFKLS